MRIIYHDRRSEDGWGLTTRPTGGIPVNMAISVELQPTLDEILSRHGLERKDLERKCPAGVRLEIAEHIIDSQREGEGATYLKLAEAVYHRNRTDLVDKLCEKIKNSRDVELSIIQGEGNFCVCSSI